MGILEAENARLREEVERLRAILYPPPPPPVNVDDGRRYLLGSPREKQPWRRLDESMFEYGFGYARETHPELKFVRAYRWDQIPEGGIYTTVSATWDAKHAKTEVVFYEIDKRTSALDAIGAQQGRLHDHTHALLDSLPDWQDRGQHRLWAYRDSLLREAGRRLDRPFEVACWPLTDYEKVIQAATDIVDAALRRDSELKLTDVPGYRPEGSWTCEKCGYPFPDSEKGGNIFTCRACHIADPENAKHQAKWVEELRAEGKDDTADMLEQAWQAAVDGASSPEIPDFVQRP